MPYKIKGKCIYKKDTGKKIGCTKGSVKRYMRALHANVKDGYEIPTFKKYYVLWEIKCWKSYRKIGMKKKGGKMVNDCRPIKEATEITYKIKAKIHPDFSGRLGRYIEGNIKATSPVNALAKLISVRARKIFLGNFIGLLVDYAKQNRPEITPLSPGQMTLF